MSLQVIGVGFGRTGTFSLKKALDLLGLGPTHHMYEVRRSAVQTARWLTVAKGAAPDFELLFEGFNAQVDWPGSLYWRDLVHANPQAKVILNHRDPEKWYDSIAQTILPASELGRTLDTTQQNRDGSEIIYRLVLEGLFEGRMDDRDFAIGKFVTHIEEVRALVPSERLLELTPGDGWSQLCDFLGCPVPDAPYPKGNSVADFRAMKPYLDEAR